MSASLHIRRVCVLGGSGFVGRSVCEHLAARGLFLRVLTRDRLKARPLLVLPTIEIVPESPHDDDALARAFDGMDAVVNLVGILHQSRPESFEKVHVDLPRRIARACRSAGVARLVHMSALHADPQGPSQYQQTRGRGEMAIRQDGAGLALTVFQPSVIFGRDDSFLNLFASLVKLFPVIPLAGADVRFQPVWVEDVARAIARAIDDPRTFGKTYPMCGPKVYSLREIVAFIASVLGKRRLVLPLPHWAAYLQAALLERLPGPVMTRDNLRSMGVDSVCGCPFPDVFGFAPSSMEAVVPGYLAHAGLRDRYAQYRQRKGN